MSTESLCTAQRSYFMALPSQTRCAVDRADSAGRSTESLGMGRRRAGVGVGARLRKEAHPVDHRSRASRTPSATTPTLTSTSCPSFFFAFYSQEFRTQLLLHRHRNATCAPEHVRAACESART